MSVEVMAAFIFAGILLVVLAVIVVAFGFSDRKDGRNLKDDERGGA